MNAFKPYASPDYISAHDLDGKEVTLPIQSAALEFLKSGPMDKGKNRICLTLKGAKKRLVLNKTNVKEIIKAYGNDTDGWVEKPITIIPTTCTAFGAQNVPCVRIKIPN